MLLEQAQRHTADYGQVLRAVALAHAIRVFSEAHVQLPVQRVLDRPVTTQRIAVDLRRRLAAADEIAFDLAGFAIANTLAIALANHTQLRPIRPGGKLRIDDDVIVPQLLATVPTVFGLIAVVLHLFKVVLGRLRKALFDFGQQGWLILFDREHVVAAAFDDLRGNLLLTAHRVDGHQGAVNVQEFQQLGNRRNFIGLLLHRHLAQAQRIRRGPGADDVQGLQTADAGATQRLAIDGNRRQAKCLMQGIHPGAEASLKPLRTQTLKHTLKGVMRRNAVGQTQEFLEPILAALAKSHDLLPIIAATDGGTERDRDDVQQQMLAAANAARIFEFAKVLLDRQ